MKIACLISTLFSENPWEKSNVPTFLQHTFSVYSKSLIGEETPRNSHSRMRVYQWVAKRPSTYIQRTSRVLVCAPQSKGSSQYEANEKCIGEGIRAVQVPFVILVVVMMMMTTTLPPSKEKAGENKNIIQK